MASLTKCLLTHRVDAYHTKRLRALAQVNVQRGDTAEEADLNAAEQILSELQDERADLVQQIESAGGQAPKSQEEVEADERAEKDRQENEAARTAEEAARKAVEPAPSAPSKPSKAAEPAEAAKPAPAPQTLSDAPVGTWQHERLKDATATVTKTEKGYRAEFGPDDVQEFRGPTAEAKLQAAMRKEGFVKSEPQAAARGIAKPEVRDLGFALPNGNRFVVVTQGPNGEQKRYFRTRDEAERAASEGQAAGESGAQGRGQPRADSRQDGDEGNGRAASRLDVVRRKRADSVKSVNDLLFRKSEGKLVQKKERAGYCFLLAAEASRAGLGDMVIGVADSKTGSPIWHAVVMSADGAIYDPTYGVWFEPGVYEAGDFRAVKTLTPSEVQDYIAKNDGFAPDAKNQGLGDPAARVAVSRPNPTDARAEAVRVFGEAGIRNLEQRGILTFSTFADLPEAIQKWSDRFEKKNGTRPVAVHWNGKAYIISDRASKGEVPSLVLHEVGEHFGLRRMLGDEGYAKLLNDVRNAPKTGALADAWSFVKDNYPNLKEGSDQFISEVIARAGEDTRFLTEPWYKRLIGQIRQFLRRLGFRVDMKAEDLGRLVTASLRRTMNGTEPVGVASASEPQAAVRGPVDEVQKAAQLVAERNRALREQDQTVWAKAKKLAQRQLSPRGLLPESVFEENILRERKIKVVDFDVRARVALLERAIRADYGKSAEALTEDEQRALNEVLAGKGDATAIPERTRTALYSMRQYIDRQSEIYLDMLREDLADKEGADQSLINTIQNNIGSYVNRSYRAFDDPNWFKKVPDDVLQAGRKYMRDGYLEKGFTPEEADKRTEVALHALLKNGTAYDSMQAFVKQSKLGAKDLSVLMRRKEVPKAIRDLLGEYVDPRLNFAKSATKMGSLIWNQIFLDRVRAAGLGSFLFEGDDRPPGATKQIAGEASETYAPLNGLWTFPDVAQAFEDALGKEKMGRWMEAIVRINGTIKYGKTVLSPTTAMRNFQSSMFFALANGHFDVTKMADAVQLIRHAFSDDAKARAYARKLTDLGVIGDGAHALEVMRLVDDSKIDELLATKTGKVAGVFKKASNLAQGFYKFGDDFWKVIGFENEVKLWKAAGLDQAAAEKKAAERVINTYPTYSMQGRLVRGLARNPIISSFPTFTAEIIRTSVNMVRYTAEDIRSKNPAIRRMGIKRAVGLIIVSGGFHALSALSKIVFGVDDDEEDAIRALGPSWSDNATYLYAGRNEDGSLRYYDISFLDPYSWWKLPFTALMRNEPFEEKAASGLADMLSPFLSTDIAFGALVELIANKKATGGPIYSPHDSVASQTTAIADHIRKAVQPGFVSNAERISKAMAGEVSPSGKKFEMQDEIEGLLGWRAATLDPKTALYYRSFDFTDARSDAKKPLTRVLKDLNPVSDDEIVGKVDEALRQHTEAYREMGRVVAAARKGGMTDDDIYAVLTSSRIPKEAADALLEGTTPPLTISNSAAKDAIEAATVRGGDEAGDTVSTRYDRAQELLEEKQQ